MIDKVKVKKKIRTIMWNIHNSGFGNTLANKSEIRIGITKLIIELAQKPITKKEIYLLVTMPFPKENFDWLHESSVFGSELYAPLLAEFKMNESENNRHMPSIFDQLVKLGRLQGVVSLLINSYTEVEDFMRKASEGEKRQKMRQGKPVVKLFNCDSVSELVSLYELITCEVFGNEILSEDYSPKTERIFGIVH